MEGMKSRRRFVQGLCTVVAAGALAGCGGDGDSEEGGGDGEDSGGEEGGDTATATPSPTATEAKTETPADTQTATATATETGESGPSVDEYLSDVGNYDGTVADTTGQDEAAVDVGAEGNGGGFAFGPPAVRVDTGTTVVWSWTGEGGLHNVLAEDDTFDSGEPVSGSDATFEYTFSEAGTYLYFCEPHKSLGMKGAIVVE
jgi:halocyanin-like protein